MITRKVTGRKTNGAYATRATGELGTSAPYTPIPSEAQAEA